jgi:hypothetical protein
MPIWRTRLDEARGQLAFELRQAETHATAFSVLELGTGRQLFEPVSFPDSWWMSLVDLQDELMAIQEYTDPQNPQSLQTFFFRLSDQQAGPMMEGFTHLGFYEGKSLGSLQPSPDSLPVYCLLDVMEGSAEELSAEQAKELIPRLDRLAKEAIFPNLYAEGSDSFRTVQVFLQERFQQQAVRQAEYLEVFDKIVISFYTVQNGQLENQLLVLNSEGESCLQLSLASQRSGAATDTFWVYKNLLLLLTDEQTFTGYELR